MTESRKIQLETTVDASGAKQGFAQMKRDGRDMAQDIAKSGQEAAKGLSAIADGAKRAADGLTREEARMRASIQRQLIDLASIGKTPSQKIELKAEVQGIDLSKLQPQLAALRELESQQARLAAGAKGQSFIGDLQAQLAQLREQAHLQGLSADEALRYKAAQAGVAEAAAPLIAELRSIQQAQEAVTNAARSAAVAQREAATLATTRTSFLSNIKQESDAIGKSRADLLALRAAELGVADAAAPMIAKLREAEQAHRGFAAGQKLNAFQTQQLGFQLHDFAVQVASGQSPLTAFVQQGSQLSGTFGGAGNAFKAVLSTITPMKLAIGGAALAVGGLALAMAHAESAARDLASVQAQLAGTGRAGMFSDAGLKDFIAQLALAPGITRASATGIVSELAKVHDIGGALFKDLGRIAVDFAAATGQKVPEATRQLARAFADPAKGAKELDDALGALSSAQLLEIDRLSRLGDVAGAQRVLLDALQGSVKGLADNAMTPLQRSTNELGNAWERLSRAFGESDGIRTVTALLAGLIDKITWLVNNASKLANLPTNAAIEGGNAVRRFLGMKEVTAEDVQAARAKLFGGPANNPAATAKDGNTAATERGNKAADEEIKRALKAGEAYKSQASQINDLKDTRERLNKALKESNELYGKNSPQSQELRGSIAGVNERIASISKRGQKGAGNEAQQVLDAQLEQSIKAAKDALAAEADAVAFAQRYLQGVYAAGETSLKDFYENKRRLIEQGVQDQIAALEKERAAVEDHLAKTIKQSPKDTSAQVKDQTRLQEIDAQQAKLRLAAGRDVVLANQEESAAFRQLNEQVLAYRANLLQLQGDEVGAAKVRAQIAIQQASILARQSQGTANPISPADQQATELAITQTNEIAAARTRLGTVTQGLSIAEERIALLQRTGAIGELEALDRLGAARSARLGQLQKEVDALEKLSAARPDDIQLKVDTSRARLELDNLKAQLDPLKEKFDGIFKDAGANLFTDLANGTKPLQAVKNFANNIGREINSVVGRELSSQLFGDGGLLGGLGKVSADIFGSKNRGVSLDTSGAEASLTNLRTAADPTTTSITDLGSAAEATAVLLRQVTGTDLPPLGRADGVTNPDGQSDTVFQDSLRETARSSEQLSTANTNAVSSVVRLASAATSGGNALGLLPQIIASISSLAGGSGNPGALVGQGLGFLTGGAAVSNTAFGSTTFADALAGGLIPLSTGGYTGDVDPRKVAGVVHGKEYVFSAEATAAIGVGRLERLHQTAKTGQIGGRKVPGYYDGGYVDTMSRPVTMSRDMQYLTPPPAQAPVQQITHHHTYPINVQMPATGMSRATALQTGREIGRGIETARKRNG